jgi:hypothetical protein
MMNPPLLKPSARYDHVYAIVRYDTTASDTPPEVRFTVKKIVTDPGVAEQEVKRLNELNKDKGCYYFSQVTRMEKSQVEFQEAAQGAPPRETR